MPQCGIKLQGKFERGRNTVIRYNLFKVGGEFWRRNLASWVKGRSDTLGGQANWRGDTCIKNCKPVSAGKDRPHLLLGGNLGNVTRGGEVGTGDSHGSVAGYEGRVPRFQREWMGATWFSQQAVVKLGWFGAWAVEHMWTIVQVQSSAFI